MKVHITQGDLVGKAVIVSWVTEDEPGSSRVCYWGEKSKHKKLAEGKFVTYRFFNYSSGFIHHTTIRHLKVLFNSITSMLCYLSSRSRHHHTNTNTSIFQIKTNVCVRVSVVSGVCVYFGASKHAKLEASSERK